MYDELIQQARELCDAAKSAKERGNALDSAAMSWAITNNCVPQLCDALEAAQKELIDYHHTQKTVDGKMSENARLRRIIDKLNARAEKAEAENRWIPVGERLPEEKGHYLILSKLNMAHGGSCESNGGDSRRNMAVAYFDVTECWNASHVTHWQKLPQPPQKG